MRIIEVDINPTAQGPSVTVSLAYEKIDSLSIDEIRKVSNHLSGVARSLAEIADHRRGCDP